MSGLKKPWRVKKRNLQKRNRESILFHTKPDFIDNEPLLFYLENYWGMQVYLDNLMLLL